MDVTIVRANGERAQRMGTLSTVAARGQNQEVGERDPEGVDDITGKQGPLRA